MTDQQRTVRIGGGAAGVGDGLMAAPVLVERGELDYLMFDFLSEYYMPIAGRMRAADPTAGYVPDVPDGVFASVLGAALQRGVRLIANAGAVNPAGCADAFEAVAARLGLSPRIAVVSGDDLLERGDALEAAGRLRQPLPAGTAYTGINAYIGAFPVARALDMGADVVVTGRVVDSALALGPLVHEFGWTEHDHDLLAAGSVVGHLLECGAQASGGLFTDWHEVEDYSAIGYPIAEVAADGTAVLTKVPGTGGRVSTGSVAEQLLYELGDPRSYLLPDVVCDVADVRIEPADADAVRVSGARGRPPGPDLKAIATWDDGWMAAYAFVVRGPEAEAKARAVVASQRRRVASMLEAQGMADFRRSHIDVLGDEGTYGAQGRRRGAREVVCRVALEHEDARAFAVLFREAGTASVSMAPGIAGSSFRSAPAPIGRSEAFYLPAGEVPVSVRLGDRTEVVVRASPGRGAAPPAPDPLPTPNAPADTTVRLEELAWVRSGDKGDTANVGVVARRAGAPPLPRRCARRGDGAALVRPLVRPRRRAGAALRAARGERPQPPPRRCPRWWLQREPRVRPVRQEPRPGSCSTSPCPCPPTWWTLDDAGQRSARLAPAPPPVGAPFGRIDLEGAAVPPGEAGGGGVGRLEERQQVGVGIGRGRHPSEWGSANSPMSASQVAPAGSTGASGKPFGAG